jgi:hypothetical protein
MPDNESMTTYTTGTTTSVPAQTSGGQLRDKLEAALARESAARELLEKTVGISPGSLKGVDPSQYAERAAEVKAEQAAADREAAARFLGIPVDQLDAHRAAAGSQDLDDEPPETPQSRTASLGQLGGRAATFDPEGDDIRGLTERDLIAAAFTLEAKQKR